MTPASTTVSVHERCPDAEQFVRLADGRLTLAESDAIDRHVDACTSCFELLAALADRDEHPAHAADGTRPLRAGDRAGRYVIAELVGRGGMGLVYAAYDPVLRRTVALKLMRPPDGARSSATRRQQLLREAQALARLSHPNVVPIHDVGTVGDELWVVMELVDGVTLRQWAKDHERASWRERLEILAACGAALAAAHAAGIVHRDFKPDNVMIGRDATRARVRVMDFGLAHVAAEPVEPATTHESGARPLDTAATRGAIGTPAYMAPEQHGGARIDARADQFAFAVTAFELLWGVRPFPGDDPESVAIAVAAGRMRELPPAAVPRRLHRVLVRALAPDPNDRWPDLPTMLRELARDPVRVRRGAMVIGAMATLVVGGLAWRELDARRVAQQCRAQAEAQVHADGDVADRLAQALADAELAEQAASRAHDWSERWTAAETAACIALDEAAAPDVSATTQQRACLHEGATALRSAVTVIVDGDAVLRTRALEIIDELPDPAACEQDGARVPPARDAATLTAVTELRERLATARVLQSAGRDRDALTLASGALVDARALADQPALAQVLEAVGSLHERVGDFEAAERELTLAYWTAGKSGADELATEAAAGIAQLLAAHLARPREAQAWARHAEMMLARQSAPAPDDRAAVLGAAATVSWYEGDYEAALVGWQAAHDLLLEHEGEHSTAVGAAAANLGVVYYELGRTEEALVELDRAIAIHTAAWGPAHPDVARDRLMRANALMFAGRLAEAEAEASRADELAARSLGDDHPDRVAYYTARGAIANALGQTDVALRWHETALALERRSLGADHPDVGITLNNIGSALDLAGRHEEAIARFEQSLAIFRAAFGPEHDKVGSALHDLALAEKGAGRLAPAIAHFRQALEIWERAIGPESTMVGRARTNLANALLLHGEPDAALREYRRAVEILAESAGPTHPAHAIALSRLGLALVRNGHAAEAVDPLGRALALRQDGPDRERIAELQLGLARALVGSGGDRGRARRLATDALATYRELAIADEIAELERLLAELD